MAISGVLVFPEDDGSARFNLPTAVASSTGRYRVSSREPLVDLIPAVAIVSFTVPHAVEQSQRCRRN
jgi:hypothetical protein